MADDPIMDALIRWESLREKGQVLAPEELCPDDPSLWEALRKRLERRRFLAPFLDPPTLSDPTAADAPFPAIPGYEILEVIGRGGMGIVYKARQTKLDRLVALKMILAAPLPEDLARFRTEAEAVARLEHPNIIQIYEVGEEAGRPYLVLEWSEAGNLARHLHDLPLAARTAVTLLLSLAQAVAHAHSRGIVHRDLKPANVLLQMGDNRWPMAKQDTNPAPFPMCDLHRAVPKIADFGLAKRLDTDQSHTRTGAVLGTPNYMAPEQAAGRTQEVGPAADIYALGAILYEMLTARPPFEGESILDTLEQVRNGDPIAPRRLRPKLERDVETICLKCLQREPRKRYASAADLAEDLRRFLAGEPIRARPVRLWERGAKWARRRPAIAVLLAVVALVTAAGLTGITWAWQRAEAALVKEGQERIRAETNSYFQRIALAQRDWQDARVASAEQILDQCSEDLRHWEWRYLKRLCHPALLDFGGHSDSVDSVAWSPDGSRLASACGAWGRSKPAEVKIWDAIAGKEQAICHGHSGAVRSIAFSSDGQRLVSGSWDRTVRIWDSNTGQQVRILAGHEAPVHAVTWSPNGRYLASGSSDRTVILWDAVAGRQVHRFTAPTQDVFCVAFSPDGQFLAAAGHEGVVWVWEVAGYEMRQRIARNNDIRALAFSPDGHWLATGGYDRVVTLWELTRGKRVLTYTSHVSDVTAVAFSPDGQYVASADADGGVKIWDAWTAQTLRVVRGHTGTIRSLAFHPAGRHLACGGDDRVVRVSDFAKEVEYRHLGSNYITSMTSSLSFHPDSRQLAAVYGPDLGARSRMIALWDLDAESPPRFLANRVDEFSAVSFQPNGEGLTLGSTNGTVRLWHLSENREIRRFQGHQGSIRALSFRQDGERFASASSDGTVRVWETATGRELHSLGGSAGEIHCVAYIPGGKYLASGGNDGKVRVWDADSGEAVGVLAGHEGAVATVAWSPDGRVLASAGVDTVIRLWDLAAALPGGLRAVPYSSLSGHVTAVTGLAFTADGRRLASSSLDQTVKLWDVGTGKEALTLRVPGPGEQGRGLAISPDNRYLVAGTRQPHVWKAEIVEDPAEDHRVSLEWPTPAWYHLQAQEAEKSRHWFGAAFHLDRLLAKDRSQASLLTRRGFAYAELGQWDKAAVDFAQAVALEPEKHSHWCRYATALWGAGDEAGHGRVVTQMCERFAATREAVVASDLLYTWLPVANMSGKPDSLLGLGQLAAGTFPGNARVYGAALCRAGMYEEAIQRFNEARADGWEYRAWDHLFLALAHHGLGHAEAARAWLDKALRWIKEANDKEDDGSPGVWIYWGERVEIPHLRKEVETLLTVRPP